MALIINGVLIYLTHFVEHFVNITAFIYDRISWSGAIINQDRIQNINLFLLFAVVSLCFCYSKCWLIVLYLHGRSIWFLLNHSHLNFIHYRLPWLLQGNTKYLGQKADISYVSSLTTLLRYVYIIQSQNNSQKCTGQIWLQF